MSSAALIDAIADAIAVRVEKRLVAALHPREQPKNDTPRFLSETDYAERYSVSRRTLQSWRLSGRKLPAFIKAGRKVLYLDQPPSAT
jgi:DNA-binding transcriptional regulator YiaG